MNERAKIIGAEHGQAFADIAGQLAALSDDQRDKALAKMRESFGGAFVQDFNDWLSQRGNSEGNLSST